MHILRIASSLVAIVAIWGCLQARSLSSFPIDQRREIGENAVLAACGSIYPRRDREIAIEYLDYVTENARTGELEDYLSDETLLACGPRGAEGPARRMIGHLVYKVGTQEQIVDHLLQIGSLDLYCRDNVSREEIAVQARVANACATLGFLVSLPKNSNH